ncbi:diaminopimelate decarboxylase [Pokkaliibacter sp. MBI-7]|uniref:diaminopimelate decarboxylase n=1 Tax=Pokkaliibacter sp. MBI-7 TaxID=3040600 RepID=UPI0024495F32|nr:diaminopimelate decarboxylase [Pokkaliibacter sp. MBI-7]MDH2432602.1 diaminopimelate decarboxylase [Pokkaliibacter sp. MBI-7]
MSTLSDQQIATLAQQQGTPLWCYDAAVIRAKAAQLKQFDTVRFAQKACSNIHILSLMREIGIKVDSVSLGELERAKRAGYRLTTTEGEAEVVFTADLFDRQTLERVVADKIEVNVGSLDMLHQLGPLSPGHRVWIRVNPGFGHGHSRKTNTGGENSKHGIWHTELPQAIAAVRQYGLKLVGLHLHIGSGVDYDHLQQVGEAMIGLVKLADHDLEAISAGGGLSIPYRDSDEPVDTAHYFELWDAVRQRIADHLGHPVRLELEPGRFLVAESGVLVAEVRASKYMGSRHFTLVDAGFNELMRPAMYGSFHRISVVAGDGRDLSDAELQPTTVAGPLCESGDVFTQGAEGVVESQDLPVAAVGDLVVFHDAGAYGATMSSNYNSRRYATEYLVDGDASRVIRRRQTFEELLAAEMLD